jgi:Rrf2 family transcriptional regulator, nitric oxide-sensitive transcriptional repressor
MRLTSFTDYGLRVLMRLSEEPAGGLTTDALARELALSRHHLQKVVQELARAGWVATRRGDGGGCVLTPRCLLRHRLARAREAFLADLDRTSLAECLYPGAAPAG